MKRTRVPLAVLALWLAGSVVGGEEAAPPRTGLRLQTNRTEATWSVSWQDTPLVTAANYGLAHEETLPIEVDFNYLKFRMYQEGGDWDTYIGYLQFGGDASGEGAEYVDSFRQETPSERYVSAENVIWRTTAEEGLICPRTQKEWAEIVYKTSQKHVWWVVRPLDPEDVVEVYTSLDGRTWSLLTRRQGEGTLPYGDSDKRPLGGVVRTFLTGSAKQQTSRFEDALGEGRKTVLAHAVEEAGLELEMALFCYDRLPLLGLEAEVGNVGRDDYPLAEIILGEARADRGGGFSLGVPPQRCSMLGNGMWMAGSAMTRFDQRSTARAYWSTAVGDRETLRAVVLGVGEAANCEARFDVCRRGDAFDLTLRAGCAHDRAGHPLVLQPGKRFRTCRYFLLACDHVNEGLECYADCVRQFGSVPELQPPYQGMFTGYSSHPTIDAVAHLNEKRVNDLMDVLGCEVGAYARQTVKIEFEPKGSPNLWNHDVYRMEDHFPQGPQALAQDIRGRGFRPALQTRTFRYVAGGEPDEAEKVRSIYHKVTREWGFEYLMLDFNSSDSRNLDPHRTFFEVIRDRFRAIRDAVGPDVFIEACMCCPGPVIGSADGFRPATDYRGGNENGLLIDFANRYYYHGDVFQLDSEFYDVAARPFLWRSRTVATPIEGNRTWCSLCAIAGLSFLVGGDVEHTSAERWDVVRCIEPVYGRRGRPLDVLDTNHPQVWTLDADYGGRAWNIIGLFNWSYDEDAELTCDFARCGLDPKRPYLLFDFWRGELLGKAVGGHTVRLRPRRCQVLQIVPEADLPTLVGTDRHVTGAFAVESSAFDAERATLRGRSAGPPHSTTRLYVYLPSAWRRPPLETENCEAELVDVDCLRLDVVFPDSGHCDWSVVLDRKAVIR